MAITSPRPRHLSRHHVTASCHGITVYFFLETPPFTFVPFPAPFVPAPPLLPPPPPPYFASR